MPTAITDIYFVTKPFIFETDVGDIDMHVLFEPDAKVCARNKVARELVGSIRDGQYSGGFNNWRGVQGPKFHFGKFKV